MRYLNEIQHKYSTTTAFYVSGKTRNYYHARGVLKQVQAEDPQDAWYFHARKMSSAYEINVGTDTTDPNRLTIFVNYRSRITTATSSASPVSGCPSTRSPD